MAKDTQRVRNMTLTDTLTFGINSRMRKKSGNDYINIDVEDLAELSNIVDVDGNTQVGISAGDSITAGSGTNNSSFGHSAGTAITTGDNNVSIGEDAGLAITTGSGNTAVGTGAAAAAITVADITAVGLDALKLSTAAGNVAVGARALDANVTGLRNVAVGVDAGGAQAGTTDDDNVWIGNTAGLVATGSASGGNVGVGSNAMLASTTSIDCVAVGFNALAAQVTGNSNVAIGADAMLVAAGATDDDSVAVGTGALRAANGGAGENTAIGSEAGASITTGNNNTMIGRSSGVTLTTGSNNICIGADTAVSATGSANQFAIGKGVVNTADKAIVIGDASDHIRCDWGSDATWDKVSDGRMKNVVGESRLGLSFINQLSPIVYYKKPVSEWPEKWGIDAEEYPTITDVPIHGMVAQDVKKALDNEKVEDFSGWKVDDKTGRQRLAEGMFIYPMINAVNELTVLVEKLQKQVTSLKGKKH